MTDKPASLVEGEVQERLEDPFVRSRTFGKLRWIRDESLLAAVLAVISAAVLVLLFLIGGQMIGPGEIELAQPNITVEEVVLLGDGSSPLDNVADAVTPQPQQQQQSAAAQPGIDAIADVDVGQGRDLTSNQLNVQQSTATLEKVPVVTLPPAPPGGGSPGASSVSGIFKIDKNIKSVVYVIDKSGSMAGSNLSRVQAELIFAINDLDETQKFSVVFFDGHAWPYLSQYGQAGTAGSAPLPMLVANSANKQLAIDWIRTMRAGGGTNPFPAVMMGLTVEPQKMVLLSDGEFSRSYVQDITNQNAGIASIDCIGFGETVVTLQQIASQNQGKYITAR